jgi:acetyltransferase-like isoleucine patch superfamily enzyme
MMATPAPVFVHPLADVQSTHLGCGTKIWQFCVVLPGARLGEECNICSHCFIENDVTLGHRVTVKCGVQLWDGVVLEDDVFIGPNVTFTNDKMPRSKHYPEAFLQTIVRRGASIGANATLLPGVEVGAYALVGAGAVITQSVPAHGLCYGNPARVRGWVCACTGRLNAQGHCQACGKHWPAVVAAASMVVTG